MRIPPVVMLLLATPVAACGFSVSGAGADANGSGSDAAIRDGQAGEDAPRDTPIDTAAGPFCYGAYHEVCLLAQPVQPYVVAANVTVDTGGGSACLPTVGGAADKVCVLAGTTVSVTAGSTLRVHGDMRALVLVATTGTIVIEGSLDISSGAGTNQGAGSGLGPCNAGVNAQAFGGGQGGSFSSIGGDGGDDGFGTHGAVTALVAPALRGGCRGGQGGNGGGSGGGGGGAAYLVAATSITVNGVITAGGAGGNKGGVGRGGGGGGSGGFIGLEAPSIVLGSGGVLLAEGGGGGEGGDGNNGENAVPGSVAEGGEGGSPGGNGGDGSQQGGVGETGSDGAASVGGGGGGGAGYIRASVTITNGANDRVSPPAGTL